MHKLYIFAWAPFAASIVFQNLPDEHSWWTLEGFVENSLVMNDFSLFLLCQFHKR